MVKVENPTLGSDVEYFLQDRTTGEIVSAEGLIRGTKDDPYRFDDANPYYATQLDNVLAEGNIPPALTVGQFFDSLAKLRAFIETQIPAELQTAAIPAARLHERFLQTETAKTFGCDPSLNCWTEEVVAPEPTGDNLRSAGFHVHIGYTHPNIQTNLELGRAMDLFLGVPSVLLEPASDRKKVGYGLAGNIRHQPHGVEYRTLSSHFASTQALIEWVAKNTQKAIEFVNADRVSSLDNLGTSIMDVINSEDKAAASKMVAKFKVPLT